RCLSFAVIGSFMLMSCIAMWGQATATASLAGTVVDKSQAVISKAEVTIVNTQTGATRTTTTGDSGEYRFDLLPVGIYNVKATVKGFSTSEAKNVELQVGRTATQNFTLAPGGVSETVEVTATAPLIDQQKT